MRRDRWFAVLIINLLLVFTFSSCAPRDVDIPDNDDVEPHIPEADERGLLLPQRQEQIQLLRIDRRNLPAQISRWIDNNLQLYATGYADTKVFQHKTYIFVARGERPTGGYEVRISDALQWDDHIEVIVRFTRPPRDAMVTQAISYPYDVAAIEMTDIPIRFTAEGNDRPSRITRLSGIDTLRDINASSHTIKVFEPSPNTETGRDVSVSGIALLPEGNVFYKLISPDGSVSKTGGTPTASPLDWGYFETVIPIPEEIPANSTFQLVLFRFDENIQRETDQVPIRLTVRE